MLLHFYVTYPLYSTASSLHMLPDSASASLPQSANWLSKLFLHPQALCLWSQVLPILLACQGSHWHHLVQAVGMQLCHLAPPIVLGCQEAAFWHLCLFKIYPLNHQLLVGERNHCFLLAGLPVARIEFRKSISTLFFLFLDGVIRPH